MPQSLLRTVTRFAAVHREKFDFVRYLGWRFYCPLCQTGFRRLKPSGGSYWIRGELVDHATPNSICPRCSSGIRHRFLFTYLSSLVSKLPRQLSVLHFAAEPALVRFFQRRPATDYIRCDIAGGDGVVQADILDLPFPEGRFDLMLCVHVLEHIQDDQRAISELFRVLKPGGHLLLAVPTYGETTWEDPTLDEAGRERMYGIGDHRRLNGLDLREKFARAGFDVRVLSTDDVPGPYVDRTVRTPHTESDRYLFHCTKPHKVS